jgi:hypothetical protein
MVALPGNLRSANGYAGGRCLMLSLSARQPLSGRTPLPHTVHGYHIDYPSVILSRRSEFYPGTEQVHSTTVICRMFHCPAATTHPSFP